MADDSLYVTHRRGFLGLGRKETLKYENGNLFNGDGSAYTGKVKGFLNKVVTVLGEITSGAEGQAMINELQNSKSNFTIVSGKSEFIESDKQHAYANQISTDPTFAAFNTTLRGSGFDFGAGSGGTIFWNSSGRSLPTTNGMQTNSSTDLAHEMFHALDSNRRLLDDRLERGIKRDEWQAVFRENTLRIQLGLPARTHYKILQNADGIKLEGTGERMLTPAPLNQPIRPVWY